MIDIRRLPAIRPDWSEEECEEWVQMALKVGLEIVDTTFRMARGVSDNSTSLGYLLLFDVAVSLACCCANHSEAHGIDTFEQELRDIVTDALQRHEQVLAGRVLSPTTDTMGSA